MESCQWAWSPVGGHGTSPSFVRLSPNDSLGARDESEAMKRFQSSLLTAVMLMSMLSFGLSNAAAESPEIVIDSAVEWVDDDSIDTIVRIVDGGDLTINGAKISMQEGSGFIIEAGGILILDNAELNAENPPTGLAGFGYWDEVNRSSILVPGSDYDSSFEATFHAPEGGSFYGGQAQVEGGEAIDINGSEFTISFDENTGDVWVGLMGYSHSSVLLASLTLTPEAGNSAEILATDLTYRNLMAHGSPGFVIEVAGELDSEDSTIFGGEITVQGSATLHDTVVERTAPILLTTESSTMVLSGMTSFTESRDDHDVRANAQADLHWGDEVVGTGGLTDRWERRLADQQLEFDAIGVFFRIQDMGPMEQTSALFISDSNGVGLINGGVERVVEIGWADGSIWTESATIEIVEYRTAWNMDSDMDDYGGDMIPLTWDLTIVIDSNTPLIEWVSVEYAETTELASINGGVAMLATIANRGSAPAVVYIACDIAQTDEAADIGGWRGERIDPGAEVTIQFPWRNAIEGDFSLECRILTPTQLVDENAFGGGTITSDEVTWYEPGDEDGGSIIPIILVLLLSCVMMGFFVLRMIAKPLEDDEDDIQF